MEALVDSIPIIQPIAIKTPILEIEANYGSPYIDAFMVFFVLAIAFSFRMAIKKWGSK